MNFKTTLILVVLVALAGGYFVVFERDRPGTRDRRVTGDGRDAPLFADHLITPPRLLRVTIERDGDRAVLAQTDGLWRQLEPVDYPLVDHAGVELARTLGELRYIDRFAPGEGDDALSLAAAGLDPPRGTVTFEHGGRTTVLRLGASAPGGHAYLLRDDDPAIHVVNDDLHELVFGRNVRQWRQRRFDTPSAGAVQRVVIDGRNGAADVRRHGGRWYLDVERTQRAAREAVEALVQAMGDLRVEQFVDDEPTDEALSLYGLDAPRLTLTLHTPSLTGEGPDATDTHTLHVGSGTDLEGTRYFAAWSVDGERWPVVFTLPGDDLEPLRPHVDDLRDPRLVVTPPREVNAIELDRPDEPTLRIERTRDRGFAFADTDPGYGPDYDTVTRMLEQLAQAEADRYLVDFEPSGDPLVTLRIAARGGADGETLRVYDAGDGRHIHAVRNDEPVAHRVSREAIEWLFKPRLALRDRDVLDVAADDLTRVTLERADGARFTFERSESGDAWAMASAERFESEALESLLGRLSPLRVERWVIADDAAVGDVHATLTLESKDGSTRVLRVDAATRYAALDGMDAVFEIGASLADAMAAEYRDRVALRVRQQEIESVRIEREDDTVVLRRRDDGRYTADDDRTIDQGRAGRLFDALAGLRVERYEATEVERLSEPSVQVTVRVAGDREYELTVREDAAGEAVAVLEGRVMRLRERDIEALRGGVE